MALGEHYAKDLLRHFDGPPEALLERQKYWDLTFLRVYLERCDEVLFDDPKLGLELARVAPALARQIPERRPFEWRNFADESEKRLHRELTVRSHAVLGGAYRGCGRLEEAERTYQTACRICDSGPVGLAARANLYKRLGRLRSAQQRYDEGLKLIDFSIEVYRDRDQDYYADALLMKGYVLGESGRSAEAIPFFGEALSLARPKQGSSLLAKRTFQSAVHNLAAAISDDCRFEDVSRGLRYVRAVKKTYARKPSSINKHKLAWVEGRMVAKLGSTRVAERRFVRVLKQFIKLGAPIEAALVALDLALIYYLQCQWDELRELAAETYVRFRETSGDREALAVLKLWLVGVKEEKRMRSSTLEARREFERLAARQRH